MVSSDGLSTRWSLQRWSLHNVSPWWSLHTMVSPCSGLSIRGVSTMVSPRDGLSSDGLSTMFLHGGLSIRWSLHAVVSPCVVSPRWSLHAMVSPAMVSPQCFSMVVSPYDGLSMQWSLHAWCLHDGLSTRWSLQRWSLHNDTIQWSLLPTCAKGRSSCVRVFNSSSALFWIDLS